MSRPSIMKSVNQSARFKRRYAQSAWPAERRRFSTNASYSHVSEMEMKQGTFGTRNEEENPFDPRRTAGNFILR